MGPSIDLLKHDGSQREHEQYDPQSSRSDGDCDLKIELYLPNNHQSFDGDIFGETMLGCKDDTTPPILMYSRPKIV